MYNYKILPLFFSDIRPKMHFYYFYGKKTKMVRIMNDTTFSRFFEVREYDSGVISMICVQILGILSKNDFKFW